MDKIVLDKAKFKEVKAPAHLTDPLIRNKNAIKKYLNEKLKGKMSVQELNFPFRPVSMIITFEYRIAKYLNSIIPPHLPKKHMLDSTSDFLERLKHFVFKPTDTLVSFDVVSLRQYI